MKQIYHNYELWEDWINGMWSAVGKEQWEKMLPLAIEFTGNAELYGAAMLRVIQEWPISCEQNLTNASINKKAWIGHAACCLEFGWPEYIVRAAWKHLSERQQIEANKMAQRAISIWIEQHKQRQLNGKGQIRLEI